MMLAWDQRPLEVANLLNPAFCAEILRRCLHEYKKHTDVNFPYPLIFLVLPVILHKRTRELINSKTRDYLDVWIRKHPEVKINFSERAKQLIPITNEAITFLLSSNSLEITNDAKLLVKNYSPKKIKEGDEVSDCFKKSQVVGKWFAKGGNPTTIYTVFGVRP